MWTASFWILATAVLIGSALAVIDLSPGAAKLRSALPGIAHGTIALAGLAVLGFALGVPAPGSHAGDASFGLVALILVALAALVGAAIFTLRLRGKTYQRNALIGVHATLAISGFVILSAYLFAG